MNATNGNANRHGTVYSYVKLGCHCAACTAANTNYHREYRARGNDAVPSGFEIDIPAIARETYERVGREMAAAAPQQQQQQAPPDTDRIKSMSMADYAAERQ